MSGRRFTRILHLVTGLRVGGAETMLRNLVTRMDRTRFENRVVTMTSGGELAAEIVSAGIPVESLDMRPSVPDPRAVFRLARLLRVRQPDLVQSWLYHADLLGALVAGPARRTLLWNVRCANTSTPDRTVISPLLLRFLARMSRVPAAVIVNSAAGRVEHERLGYRPRRWEVIPNGFDIHRFAPNRAARAALRARLGVSDDALLFGLIARFDPLKDHGTFLDAAGIAARQHDIHFVLAGKGVNESNELIRARSQANHLNGRIHFLGQVRDVERVIGALDVACSTSVGEGFPNVVGEAMACGIPVIATDVGDTAWLVGANTGMIVPPSDPKRFADAMMAMAASPDARREAGRLARERIVGSFSLGAMVQHYEGFYESVAAQRVN
ncbi:MAG TPA: glycosyltransferase [Thermoanaerobaculia bacterium]|nr:glycosyltransferase [Thermoanaerobaculia bacterium]